MRSLVAVVTLALGTLSVLEGSRVLLGFSKPAPPVLLWLVAYNVLAGVISVAVAFAIYRNAGIALVGTLGILGVHAIVLATLVGLHLLQQPVAVRSIAAMAFRVTVWALASALVFYATRRE